MNSTCNLHTDSVGLFIKKVVSVLFSTLCINTLSLLMDVDSHIITFVPPPPPRVTQDEDDEEEGEEEGGGLSKSGKELKKLLGKANGLNESDAEDDDDDDDVSFDSLLVAM